MSCWWQQPRGKPTSCHRSWFWRCTVTPAPSKSLPPAVPSQPGCQANCNETTNASPTPPPTVLWHNPPSLLGTCQSAAQDCNQQKSVAWLYYTYNVNKTYLILKETFWKRDVPRWDGNVGVTETQTVLCESKKTAVNRESQYFNKTGWDSAATYKRMKERGWKDARIMKWMVYLTKGRPQMRQKLIH